jgi:hypothetical protein
MMMTAISAAALLAASLPGNYDCTIERQAVVTETGVQPGDAVQFPETERDAWRFSVRVRAPANAAPQVEVRWPANPIQIAGTHAAIDLAPGHVAFMAAARGPCMFTEINCASLIQLSAREDGSAAFTIMPAGLAGPTQLHVIFIGSCRRQNGS